MTQTRCTGANAIVYFAVCIGLFIMITYSNANVIYGEDDESVRLFLLLFQKFIFIELLSL